MRAAVYSGTRNLYKSMIVAAKTLLMHSNVEKIYFLIEDDIFPYDLPSEIECINISNQQYFPSDGPNFNNVCTYMVLIRAAYTKIFFNLDKILTIDIDTIVNENISSLWDIDLTDYYLAAVEEKKLSEEEGSYFNMGVAMLNLKKIREDKKDDELINNLNTYWYRYKEQDCFNEAFRGKVLILPSDYNVCKQSYEPKRERITHFAGIYKLNEFPHFQYAENSFVPMRNIPDKIDLDIIIPTYKNKKGLCNTLNSIPKNENINIIVVDDHSEIDYSDILEQYPQIKFFTLEKNCGPGCARQYGFERGTGTYITFLDTGDYFYENGAETILNQIQENTYIKMYTFSYVYDDRNILSDTPDDKTIGSVYKRSFIEMYGINFSKDGSYANEDYGFSRACKLIFAHLERRWHFHPMTKHIKIPVFYEHIDKNSLTKQNNNDFFYTKLSPGIIINGVHAIEVAKNAYIEEPEIMEELAYIMAQEYFFFICILHDRPELADDIWNVIREFYFKYYRTYIKYISPYMDIHFISTTMRLLKSFSKNWDTIIPMNIKRFMQELETEEYTPLRYLQ